MSANEHSDILSDGELLVVFELAGDSYGVEIAAVNTIIRMENVTEIPRTPSFVEGVINLRGSIIPVIDLRKRFGLVAGEYTKASRIAVVESKGQLVGLIVDAVTETLRLPQDSIEQTPSVANSADSDFVRGVGKLEDRLVVLLDLEKILSNNEAGKIANMGRTKGKSESKAA